MAKSPYFKGISLFFFWNFKIFPFKSYKISKHLPHGNCHIGFGACAALLKKSVENGHFRPFSPMKFKKVDMYDLLLLNMKSEITRLAGFCSWADLFEFTWLHNPEDWLSHDSTQLFCREFQDLQHRLWPQFSLFSQWSIVDLSEYVCYKVGRESRKRSWRIVCINWNEPKHDKN